MKIGYLGAGAWGFALANLLASKGLKVTCWSIDQQLVQDLNAGKEHPILLGHTCHKNLKMTSSLTEAVEGADVIVESVTAKGLRPVAEQVKALNMFNGYFVITSKGIEQESGMILTDVLLDVLGSSFKEKVGCLSGPSYADEVIRKLPTSVVCASYSEKARKLIAEMFTTDFFRVYPNQDLRGVAFGGALKNIIGIACGVAEGLGLGFSARAALMTRGLHEMRKLAVASGCKEETLNGLSGMGDLCVTCSAMTSRNFKFGYLLTQGISVEEAKKKIGMVVEGAYTCVSALKLSKALKIPMPISEAVYAMIYEGIAPKEVVKKLMQREIKEEHL
jgi:glycerol-3-phosphate dehydrogenase (NAD(P)+)